ncbi:MAG: hypothetical protein M1840_006002 [Geoglossum simile]|nr:MAG: hypothetical protein M1840_006002 [Geoglossum simile]
MKDVVLENSDNILFEQLETSHEVKKKWKSMQLKKTLEIEVTDYSSPKLLYTSTDGHPQEPLAIFMDPIASLTLTLLSFISDLPNSSNSCLTGNNTLRGNGYYDIDNFDREILGTELGAGPEKLTNVMIIDLIEDKPLTTDDSIF